MAGVQWIGEVPEPDILGWLGQPDYKLPSGESAGQLVSGDITKLPLVAWHTVLRSMLVGTGMAVAGMPLDKNWLKYSLAGGLGIEAFILIWALYKRGTEK